MQSTRLRACICHRRRRYHGPHPMPGVHQRSVGQGPGMPALRLPRGQAGHRPHGITVDVVGKTGTMMKVKTPQGRRRCRRVGHRDGRPCRHHPLRHRARTRPGATGPPTQSHPYRVCCDERVARGHPGWRAAERGRRHRGPNYGMTPPAWRLEPDASSNRWGRARASCVFGFQPVLVDVDNAGQSGPGRKDQAQQHYPHHYDETSHALLPYRRQNATTTSLRYLALET